MDLFGLIIITSLIAAVSYLSKKDKKSNRTYIQNKKLESIRSKTYDNQPKAYSNVIDKIAQQNIQEPDDKASQINKEKREIFDEIENTKNHIFVTGKAGTGKSHLLKYLKANSKKQIVVCAPTGVAALNIKGQTIHSLFKIPPRFVHAEDVRLGFKVAEILRHIQIIVIDEISMVSAELLDVIDNLLRQARDPRIPFGGAQVVMFGDPFQLPPVVNHEELQKFFSEKHGGFHFFNAKVWENASFETHELQEVFRQKDDSFIDILNQVRVGEINNELIEKINQRVDVSQDNEPTIILSTTNDKVNYINTNELSKLDSKEFLYQAEVVGDIDKRQFPAEEFLKLKKGAQIMMLKNDSEERWVNGSLGTIDSLNEKEIKVNLNGFRYTVTPVSWDKINYFYNRDTGKVEEEVIGKFIQFPIKLAWAITIHKSQGQTFDRVVIDLDAGAFTTGQVYVALSRCRTLEGINLTRPVRKEDIKVDPDVVRFMNSNSVKANSHQKKKDSDVTMLGIESADSVVESIFGKDSPDKEERANKRSSTTNEIKKNDGNHLIDW